MPISYIGGAESQQTDGSAITLTLPGGLLEGDLVLVFEGRALNALSGMTTGGYATHASGTTSAALACYYKFMGSSPDTTAVIAAGANNAGHAGIARVYRGVDPTVPFDVTATQATGASTNPNPPSITPVTFGVMSVTAAASAADDAAIVAPTNYGNQVDINSNSTNDSTLGTADRALTTKAAEDPATWTVWSTGAWRTMSILLRPLMIAWEPLDAIVTRSKASSPALRAQSFFWSTFGRIAVLPEQPQPQPVRRKGLSAAVIASGLFWSGVTPVPDTIVATAFADTTQLYRRTLLYQSTFTPPESPLLSVTGDNLIAASGTDTTQLHPRSLLYHSLQEPLRVAVATPDQWHRPLAEPVRVPSRVPSQQFLAWSEYPIVAGPDIWWPQISEPVRAKPRQTAGLTWTPFQFEARDWQQPLSEPVRAKPRPTYQQSFIGVVKPEPGTNDTRPDQWSRPFSEPVRAKPVAFQAFFSGNFTPAPTAVLIEWHRPLSEPVRRTVVTTAFVQSCVPFVENVTLDKYYRPLSEPTRAKQLAAQQGLIWAIPFQFIPTDWIPPLTEPVRVRPRPHGAFIAGSLKPEPINGPDQWLRQFSEPTRGRSLAHQAPSFVFAYFTPASLGGTDDFRPFDVTVEVHYRRSLLYPSVQAPPVDFSPAVVPEQWWRPFSEPVRIRGLNPALQQELISGPDPLLEFTQFQFTTTVRGKRSILYQSLAEPTSLAPDSAPGTDDWKPFDVMIEVHFRRTFIYHSIQEPVEFQPVVTVPIIGNITSTSILELPVDVVLHGQQIEYKITNYSSIPPYKVETSGHFPKGKVRRLKGKKPSFVVRTTKKGYDDKGET